MDKEFQKKTATPPSSPAPAQESIGSQDSAGYQDSATGKKGKSRSRRSLPEREAALKKRDEALKKAKERLKKEAREQRNGQLIAWGIFIEMYYKCCGANERNEFREEFKKHLKGRELDRALAGCDRLDAAVPAEKEEKDQETETTHGVGERIKNFCRNIVK